MGEETRAPDRPGRPEPPKSYGAQMLTRKNLLGMAGILALAFAVLLAMGRPWVFLQVLVIVLISQCGAAWFARRGYGPW